MSMINRFWMCWEDPELAKANRDYLRGFYGIIKDSPDHVRFVFVTGISMFSKVSLFSGLNNLEDISLNPKFSSICGYTDEDLDTVFASELPGLDREEIRRWYNGYNWLGKDKLYNPFDVLRLLKERKFKSWWMQTGEPRFLYKMVIDRGVNPMTLENRVAEESLISKLDVGDIGVDALLFQTGYLTIVGEQRQRMQTMYTLSYPNLEIESSLNFGLLHYVTNRGEEALGYGQELAALLAANDFDEFGQKLQAYLSGIPHQWYDVSELERFEGHYASMVYMAFRSVGMEMVAEDASSHGRSDMVLFEGGQVFVLEFKVAESEGKAEEVTKAAMAQLRQRGYGQKYRDRGEPIHLVAMVFGRSERNLLEIRSEKM